MKNKSNKETIGCLMLLLTAIIWGFGVSIQSISGQTLGANTVVFFKALGAILLIPISIKFKQRFTKETFTYGILMGSIMYFACFAQQKGIESSTVGKSSFITALYTVLVAVLGFIFFKKKTKPTIWLSVGLASVGMYLLCIKEEFIFSSGDIWLLIGAICFALQILIADKCVKKYDPIPIACVQSLTMCVIAFVPTLLIEKPSLMAIKDAWFLLLYSALLSCCFAQTVQLVYQQYVEPTLSSLIMSLESVFGVIAGFLVLNQTLTLKEVLGCVLIFVAVIIAIKS